MADVTINYEGSSIATMSASGTKTLLTEGKYCTDDIEVVYVSPGGGGGSYTLLNSGSYTKTEDGQTMQIPVSYSGTVKSFYVVAHNGNANGGTWAWCHVFNISALSGSEFPSVYAYKYGTPGTQSGTANPPSITSSQITVSRYNTSNVIKAQDYDWFIYGEAS